MGRLPIVLALVALFVACEGAPPPPQATRPDVYLAPDSRLSQGLVPRDSTLEAMLRDHGLQTDVVHGVIAAVKTVFDPRRLRSLQPFSLEQSLDGALRLFEYEIDASSFLRVKSVADGADGLRAEVVPIPTTVVPAAVTGAIDDDTPSLFQSIEAAGEQPDLAVAMAQIFGGEIDFNTELQPGDRYSVAFERLEREGRRSSYGVITAAEFQNDGRVATRDPIHTAGRPARLLRSGGALTAPILPEVAAQVRATSHVRFLRAADAPGASHVSRPSWRGLRRAHRIGSRVGRVRASPLSHLRRDQWPHGAREARLRLRLALPSPVGVRTRDRVRCRCRAGADRRACRVERSRYGPAPSLRPDEERHVRQPAQGTQEHAARRSCSAQRTPGLQHRT